MDFKLVLERLLTAFKKQNNIQYALMGGFALGAWGVPWATVDIDTGHRLKNTLHYLDLMICSMSLSTTSQSLLNR